MAGFVWAAIVVTAGSVCVGAMVWTAWHRDRAVLAAFLTGLPLSFLVNGFVKTPITLAVERAAWPAEDVAPWSFFLLALWIAPVVEEAAKLLPLGIPGVRAGLLHPESLLRIGLASGFGFGLGEAWYLAWSISRTPAYSSLAFLYFTGYVSERIIALPAHAVMTSVAFVGSSRGTSAWAGYSYAVAIHAFLNVGPLAYQLGLIGHPVRSALTLASIALLALVFGHLRQAVYA